MFLFAGTLQARGGSAPSSGLIQGELRFVVLYSHQHFMNDLFLYTLNSGIL